MIKRYFFIFTLLFVLLFAGMTGKALGDTSAQFKQANTLKTNKQYDQAEQVYLQILENFPDANDALKAQKQLTYLYIITDRQAEAETAFAELTAGFVWHKAIAQAVWGVGVAYKKAGNNDKAEECHQYNVSTYPADKYAMWSQVEIVYSHIRGDKAGDADAAVDKLLGVFSSQPSLPKEINQIARRYRRAGRAEKAMELRKYNVAHYPKSKYAMWSQLQIITAHIRDGNDTAADAAAEKLLSVFSGQETLPKEIRKIANTYKNKAKRAEKAIELHRYNVDNFPDNSDAMGSQLDVVNYYISEANDANAAEAAAGKLLDVFSDRPGFAKEVYEAAGKFKEAGWAEKAVPLYQYNVDYFPEDANALLSQVEIAYFHIKQKDDAAVDAAVDKLLTTFSEQAGLPRKIRDVGVKLYRNKMLEKALELHRYNVERYPEDKYAMWSQVEIASAYIRDPNATSEADAAVSKLLSAFSEQVSLPREIRQIANKYNKAGRPEKALQFHKYNIENFPDDANAMWSQVDIFNSYIADGNNPAAADAAVEELLRVFADNAKLAKAVRNVARTYNKSGRSDKAMELWMRNIDNSPNNVNAMLSQMDIIYSYIDPNDGNDAAVDSEVEKLLTVFGDEPSLPQKVHFIANRYRKIGKYERAIHFYELVGETWPEDKLALTSRVEIGKLHIELGNDEATQAIIDGLIADYKEHPALPRAVFRIGEKYYNQALSYKKDALEAKMKEHFAKAIAVWERIITELPESGITPRACYLLAHCYLRLGAYEYAIEYFEKIILNWPDCEYARQTGPLVGYCSRRLERSKRIVILPEKLKFINVKKGEECKQTFSLAEGARCDLGNIKLDSSSPAVIPVVAATQLYIDHESYLIEVTVETGMLAAGQSYDEFIEVKTENPKYAHIKIPVHIEIAPPIKVSPSLVAWGMAKIGEKLSRTIHLSSPYGESLEVLKIISPADIETAVKVISKDLELVISEKFNKTGRYEEHMKIVFAKPSGVEIIIRMYGLVEE